jgi:hypothetical protein
VIWCRHEFSIPQTCTNSSRRLFQSKQGRSQNICRNQGHNNQYQGRQCQDYGQHSWHRTELQNDFYQYATNTCRYTCLGLGFRRCGYRGAVYFEIGKIRTVPCQRGSHNVALLCFLVGFGRMALHQRQSNPKESQICDQLRSDGNPCTPLPFCGQP